jgi:hypothetical protein
VLKTIQPKTSSISSGTSKPSTAPVKSDHAKIEANTKPDTPKSKRAPGLDERFFLVGVFYDFVKTLTRITTGSYLPSVISNFLKDRHVTLEESIYKTTFDDLVSRFLCDMTNAVSERVFNGKTKLFGFKIPKIASEISSQMFATPVVFLSRAATNKQSVNKGSVKHHSTPEEQALEAEVSKRPFIKVTENLTNFFQTKIKPTMDVFLKHTMGIEDGQEVKDSEGKVILKENGKPLKTQPKVNYPWFFTSIGGSFLASTILLPKNTQQAGFGDVKGSAVRGFLNILWNTFCRLNTTLISSSTNIHAEGKNFDACFENSVQDKTFLPFVQYTCDALASVLSDKLPFINGFTLSTILRIVTEVPITFLKSGIQRLAKDTRVSDEWSYLSYKVLKPFTNRMETYTKPLVKFLTKNLFTRFPFPFIHEWRIFDPQIKNMYDIDIQKNKAEAKEGAEQHEGSWFKTMWLLIKHSFLVPFEVYDLVKEGRAEYKIKTDAIEEIKNAQNAKLEEGKLQAHLTKKLQELGINPDQIRATKPTPEPKSPSSPETKRAEVENLALAI